MRRNYFVEGLQGAGKTTFMKRLSEHLQKYKMKNLKNTKHKASKKYD